MRLSFKYKFILSFVTLELIFISLIVFFNFASIQRLSYQLVESRIETGTSLFSEMVKTPLIVYDLAELENAVEGFLSLKSIAAIKVSDAENRELVVQSKYPFLKVDAYNEVQENILINGRTFKQSHAILYVAEQKIGEITIFHELTEALKTIYENKQNTFFLIWLEISISILVAFLIGYRLTRDLDKLKRVAENIENDEAASVPQLGSKNDEIHLLSKAMQSMQSKISSRSLKLVSMVEQLQDSSAQLKKERDFHSALFDVSNAVIVVTNAEGTLLKCNNLVQELTGFSENELIGKAAWEVLVPKAHQREVRNCFCKLVEEEYTSQTEVMIATREGQWIPLAWSSSCTFNEAGQVESVISVGVDIRDRIDALKTVRALLNSPSDSMLLMSVDGMILEANGIAAKNLNSSVKQLKGKNVFECLPEECVQLTKAYLFRVIITKESYVFEEVVKGEYFENHIYPILDIKGDVGQISLFSRNVTELKDAQKELKQYVQLVDANVITARTDNAGVISSVSQAFCDISGYSEAELIGKPHSIVKHKEMPSALYKRLWETISSGKVWRGEIKNRAKAGHYYWVDETIHPTFSKNGDIIGYSSICQDITDKKMIEKFSITDPLTTLNNRRYFDKIFGKELNRAKRERKVFCLLLLDVDYFKLYNDNYGHQMGDLVLRKLGAVLKEYMKRSSDYAFRMGGEEFAAIFTVNNESDGFTFANGLCRAVEALGIEHGTNRASDFVTASLGLATIDFDKNESSIPDQSKLYKFTDDLLYQAKDTGRNNVVYKQYHPAVNET